MADATYSDLGGLLGQIPALMQQFQPSDQDKAEALKMAKLQFFLGMMGARQGSVFQDVANSGINAVNNYQNTVRTEQALRNQNIQAAVPLLTLAKQIQAAQDWQKAMGMNANPNVPTQPGPPAAFQQPGGASSLMTGALGGGSVAPSTLPTQVPVPGAISPEEAKYNRLAALNIRDMAMGLPDKSAAIKTMFPEPIVARANAGIYSRFGNVIAPPAPTPPPGSRFDPGTNSFLPVGNAPQAMAAPTVAKNLADLATEQQIGVLPGGGEGVVGTKLGAMGGANDQYSFLNNLFGRGSQTAPAGSAPTAPAANTPVQTKLSPEQVQNSKALGEDLAGYREQVSKSSNAMAQLSEISAALDHFTTGPTLPMRAKVASFAQEIPVIGQSIADRFVPNSATALPAIAAMEKIGVGLTAEQSKVFGSREGQQVIGMIKSAMPNAEMVPGAPQIIVDAMKGMHQWSIDKGMAAQAWIKNPANHGSLDGFSTAWDAAHPVSSYVGNLPALAALANKQAPAQAAPQPNSQAKTVVRTGVYNGKRVVQYSDGTVSYQ